jgi:hypothetical protein
MVILPHQMTKINICNRCFNQAIDCLHGKMVGVLLAVVVRRIEGVVVEMMQKQHYFMQVRNKLAGRHDARLLLVIGNL